VKLLQIVILWGCSHLLFCLPVHAVIPAPEFTHHNSQDWLNSQPLKLADLKGKVVLMDVWTFGCWNCYRSFPWLGALESRLAGKNFMVIGIHSPEFAHERDRQQVIAKVKEFKLHHPIMLDNDFSYWRALNNQFWPAFYILDKQGQIKGRFIGETHERSRNAIEIEQLIQSLL